MNEGWQCPGCKMIYAPLVRECHCQRIVGGPVTVGPFDRIVKHPNVGYGPVMDDVSKV